MPHVSIVIPLYNAEPFIVETLESVREQSFTDWEAVVVDDGSTDRSLEAAHSVTDPRIRVLRQNNQGPSAARNLALENSSGEWIATLDADDLWTPDKLQHQLDAATRHRADLVFGPAQLFGDPHQQRAYEKHEYVLAGQSALRKMISRNHVPHSSVLMRRQAVLEAGGYAEDIHGTEDYDLWLRLLMAGAKFVYDPRAIVHYRVSGASVSSNKARMKRMTRVVLQRRRMPGLLLNAQRRLKMIELRFSERRHRAASRLSPCPTKHQRRQAV